ncbi:hypothetical protein OHI49_002317 [Salmonella enterica]|nr:hypothetical protein [Salmonella enterica]EJY7993419.1 hypothetical protein [Salmonella enterica]HAK6895043.1 hypothetical protein [Salmonella enterica]
MPITLNFAQRKPQALDNIEIYRKTPGNATIDVNAPGTPLATLPGDATSYEDNAVENNTTYRYWIAAVKDGERVFNTPTAQGFFLDTGPGPQKLLYGDWHAGYFGTVTPAELFTNVELNSLVVNMFSSAVGAWHKFIYKNRILFMSDNSIIYASPQFIYNQGLMYGQDGNGYVPGWATARNQRRTVTKNGYEYVVRLPYLFDYKYWTSYVGSGNTELYLDGEWFNTFARLYNYSGQFPRFDDLPVGSIDSVTAQQSAFFAAMNNSSSQWYNRPPYPESPAWSNYGTTTVRSIAVLELVLP